MGKSKNTFDFEKVLSESELSKSGVMPIDEINNAFLGADKRSPLNKKGYCLNIWRRLGTGILAVCMNKSLDIPWVNGKANITNHMPMLTN